MTQRLRSGRITRSEILVLVVVGAFFLSWASILCLRMRADAAVTLCRDNLSAIGRAMLFYAGDYEDTLPRAGGRNTLWGAQVQWDAPGRYMACGLYADGSGGEATITSCFYLLVKYAYLAPKTFVCPGDVGTTEFRLVDLPGLREGFELADAWDFGPQACRHCSYAYHMPFGLYGLRSIDEPGLAVAADRSPWGGGPAGEIRNISLFEPDCRPWKGTAEQAREGNSFSHGGNGQNVLFLDGHVSFAKRSYCGLDDDNIYLVSNSVESGSPVGTVPRHGDSPLNMRDSVLVNDLAHRVTTTQPAPEVDSRSLARTAVVATLDCPLPEYKNVVWCSTFQMAWDKFKNDIVKEPIRIPRAADLARRLNDTEFPLRCIEKESYYVNVGPATKELFAQIQKDMARRFPSEPAPTFDERFLQAPEPFLAYAYLKVDVRFAYPYYTHWGPLEFRDSKGAQTGVTAFSNHPGGPDGAIEQVRRQVEVLYYKDGNTRDADEFAVDLCTHTQPYQVVLARVPHSDTLNEAIRAVQRGMEEFRRDANYETLRRLRPIDSLLVPDVLFKLTHHFEELLGKHLGNNRWQRHFIWKAMQKIDFTLSRTGVTVKSEARLKAAASRPLRVDEPRWMHFNRPFLIYVKQRRAEATPFFIMWVDNAELMQQHR